MSLFSCWGLKSPSDTTAADKIAAKTARAEHEQKQIEKFESQLFTEKLSDSKKKKIYSNRKEAVKMRLYRKKNGLAKPRVKKVVREKSAVDASKFEKETHYEDSRGKKRLRKTIRSRAEAHALSKSGHHVYTDTEKDIILAKHDEMHSKEIGHVSYMDVAKQLRRHHMKLFGPGVPGMKKEGIGAQAVRWIVLRHYAGEVNDARGRPPALPEAVLLMIIAAFTSVLSARATIVSAPMLQPIAIGCIVAAGHAKLLNEGRAAKRGRFVCGIAFVRQIMKERGWRSVKPQGDTRKVPSNWEALCWQMVLRLAYFVFVHQIPKNLVVNADHTGIMYTQLKGKMWITKQQADAKDKSVRNHGDKRQFTLLASTAASGTTLPHQAVVAGTTSACLPKFPGTTYTATLVAKNKQAIKAGEKGKVSACHVLKGAAPSVVNIGSFCATVNHWSDDITTRAYVSDILVPYYKSVIEAMHAADPDTCQPYGKQHCVLILDVWWGWLDADFKKWLTDTHPWIHLVFVPPRCTPVGQPMDAGIIAKLKGLLRKKYGTWVLELTVGQLKDGIKPEAVTIPTDVPMCKKKLLEWLSAVVVELNQDKKGVAKCWESTSLLKAWDHEVQVEASTKLAELFPNREGLAIDLSEEPEEAEEAAYLGLPFVEPDPWHDSPEAVADEWEGWVNWSTVGAS